MSSFTVGGVIDYLDTTVDISLDDDGDLGLPAVLLLVPDQGVQHTTVPVKLIMYGNTFGIFTTVGNAMYTVQ